MAIFTGRGDDGTTGLYFGGRVRKDDPIIRATGAADEAQAMIGFARAAIRDGGDIEHDLELVGIERDLWVLMAEINADSSNREKLVDGQSRVSAEMLTALEERIAALESAHQMPKEFVVPGEEERAARLDLARVAVRRAERECVGILEPTGSAIAYLNRLSSYLWALARVFEGRSLLAKKEEQ